MKGFCENCRDNTHYNVKKIDKEKSIRGKTIKYEAKVAYCNECEEEIFVSEIRDYNLIELDKAYRNAENLIEVEDIKKILKRYDIGKRPLSLLLGWGEGTLTRYVDGDIPSKPYSDMLKHIFKDENYYLGLLEENKDNISTVAYAKTKATIENISLARESEISKIDSAVKYLLVNSSEITPLALQKLLYFAQGFHKAFTNTYMFDEECEAWAHGPVYRDVYYKYRTYGYNPIEEKELSLENIHLSEDEKELLDHVVLYLGCYSGKILEKITHSEKPWRVARGDLNDWESSARIIDKEEIGKYFTNVKEKYHMLNFTDMKDYSKDFFSKLYS